MNCLKCEEIKEILQVNNYRCSLCDAKWILERNSKIEKMLNVWHLTDLFLIFFCATIICWSIWMIIGPVILGV